MQGLLGGQSPDKVEKVAAKSVTLPTTRLTCRPRRRGSSRDSYCEGSPTTYPSSSFQHNTLNQQTPTTTITQFRGVSLELVTEQAMASNVPDPELAALTKPAKFNGVDAFLRLKSSA